MKNARSNICETEILFYTEDNYIVIAEKPARSHEISFADPAEKSKGR